MSRLKGPAFPSFAHQGTPTERQQWISHTGKRQRIKYLRILCKDVLTSKDPETLEVLAKAREFVAGKFEEYGLLMMIHQAKDVEDSTGIPFSGALDYIVDKLIKDSATNEVDPSGVRSGVDPNPGDSDDRQAGAEVAREASGQEPPPINQIVIEEESQT